MSFIITVYVKEGIVMASDSRTTYSTTTTKGNRTTVNVGVHISDTTFKTFLCPNNIGISTCGDSSIRGTSITGYIEAFILEKIGPNTDVADVPRMLINYFQAMPNTPDTNFIVAGYHTECGVKTQHIYSLNVKTRSTNRIDTSTQGARWLGATQTLSKIIQNTYMKDSSGREVDLGQTEFSWGLFTLQDAIDFALYALDVTIKTMHYSNIIETVGGPIDILVIKPDQAFWIQHKQLHA